MSEAYLHLLLVRGKLVLGVISVRDALPRELGVARSQAEFNEQLNDVLG